MKKISNQRDDDDKQNKQIIKQKTIMTVKLMKINENKSQKKSRIINTNTIKIKQ